MLGGNLGSLLYGDVSVMYSKIVFSENKRGMKLKLGIHAFDVGLYIVCVLLALLIFFCSYFNLKLA